MKESEAKTKRCCGPLGCGSPPHDLPEVIVDFEPGEAWYVQIQTAMCIGSECMAWRWTDTPGNYTEGYCGHIGENK